jgi:hypothetical protein
MSIDDLTAGHSPKSQQQHDRCTNRQLEQRLASTHCVNVSFWISTWACTGKP